jgi:hypothetical protein
MRPLLLIVLLAAPWAWAQQKPEPAKAEQPQQPQQPAKPLILRIDQLPASERGSFTVHEAPSDNAQGVLPRLGGEPAQSYSPRRPIKHEDGDPIQ